MWIVLVVDTDNTTNTPALYKAKSEEEARRYIIESYKHDVSSPHIAEDIRFFEWRSFGDKNLRLRVIFNNGVIEEYVAMEVKDYFEKCDKFAVYWFSYKDPRIIIMNSVKRIRATTCVEVIEMKQKNLNLVEGAPYNYLYSSEDDDEYIYRFNNGDYFILKKVAMSDLANRTYYDYEEYYE